MPINSSFDESFYRCPECDEAYFEVIEESVISKRSTNSQLAPVTEKTRYHLKCSSCEKIYTQEELNNNE